MWTARLKLGSLLLSQAARVGADVALAIYVLCYLLRDHEVYAWNLVAFLLALPPVLLAPVYGFLCDRFPRSRVLAAAAFGGAVVYGLFPWGVAWLWCWSLVCLRAAVYRVAAGALLPGAAAAARLGLPRVNGLALAAAAGLVYALLDQRFQWTTPSWWGWPAPLLLAHGLSVACLAFALLANFREGIASPVRSNALHHFLATGKQVWRDREARRCLLGLTALSVFLVLLVLPAFQQFSQLCAFAASVAGGLALGALLPVLQGHPRRALCFVPLGATCLIVTLLWLAVDLSAYRWWNPAGRTLRFLSGLSLGMMYVPLQSLYQLRLPLAQRGNGMALLSMVQWLALGLFSWLAVVFLPSMDLTEPKLLVALMGGAAMFAAVLSLWIYRREVIEQLIEFPFALMYRFRARGSGVALFPQRGPVLVIANHSSWLDPMWLAKVLPRTVIPMMTSAFFDRRALRWSMVHLFDAIRVEQSRYRREVPELKHAVAALDAGKCLVVFPEGELRKRAEKPLKRFGQGVWHILRERPDTPVVVCWIEGGWGCYFSYCNGPPTRNKPFDFRRPLDIAVAAPQVLSPEVLEDQLRTRQYLMQECLRMRASLGLPPVALEQPEAEVANPHAEETSS